MKKDDFLELEGIFRKITKKIPGEWRKHTKSAFSRTEALVLYKLYYEGQQRASELAMVLSITTGGLTGLTDKLVEGGYVERKRTEEDRRVVYLSITDSGKEMVKAMNAARKAFIEKLFNGISTEELNQFKNTAAKLLRNFEDVENQ
ncbi:MarR family transcriptional regulator [Lentibacillus sp. L22]|uniref:MarR family winged helix-turn-helix transcriptional regulator n=1 Tax=Lentibacillus TaxID=175304 RepID=UPI0022B1D1C3|nr:MarR family transcriptional regulator [Lentibacillus daqui]